MTRLYILFALTLASSGPSDHCPAPDPLPTQQLQALTKEYEDRVTAFEAAFRKINDAAKRDDFFRDNFPPPEQFYPRFLALAEKYPSDPAAVAALVWVVNHASPEPKDPDTQRKALDALRRDHVGSDQLPQVFERADEEFLRAVLDKSPHRTVRGLACFALAERRVHRARSVTRWRTENADWEKRKWLTGTPFEYLLTTDVGRVTAEAEGLFEQVVEKYADVRIDNRRNGETLGELAKGHLHEIRNLAIGKPAPALESVDLSDKRVRLSDLKGRVVVIDVWATWCGPCRAMIPHQRELVTRLRNEPFTLVSVSVDEKPETVVEFLKKEPMPWDHWYNGPKGPIIAGLNVWSYPTIYVVDANGVIRYKDVRGKALDRAVDALLAELKDKPVAK